MPQKKHKPEAHDPQHQRSVCPDIPTDTIQLNQWVTISHAASVRSWALKSRPKPRRTPATNDPCICANALLSEGLFCVLAFCRPA